MKVYIVQGSTGEYSDHIEWLVCGYVDEKLAQERVNACSARARELIVKYTNRGDIPDGANEHDPRMQVDYTGVNYTYVPCIIEDL